MSAHVTFHVILKASRKNVPLFLMVLKGVHAGVNAHQAQFPALPVPISVFLDQIEGLDGQQVAVKARIPGAAAARAPMIDDAFTTVESYRGYVEGLCNKSPSFAATLAQAAGMKLAAVSRYVKPLLGVKQGLQSGEVVLSANVTLLAQRKGYRFLNWSYTIDGGQTSISAPSTPRAKTTIAGLPALTTCGFRVCLTDATGQREWSHVETFFVR